MRAAGERIPDPWEVAEFIRSKAERDAAARAAAAQPHLPPQAHPPPAEPVPADVQVGESSNL
jgi:hypothetical protein